MSTTHAFITGRSQAVWIPKEYRLPDEEIFANQIGNTITLTPVSKQRSLFRKVYECLRLFSWKMVVLLKSMQRGPNCNVHAGY